MSEFDTRAPKEAPEKGGAASGAGNEERGTLSAAALKYDASRDRAPHVVAAGSGHMAQRILQTAIENGIAIYHDDSAATMLAKLDVGKEIPPELYQIVVNIYISLLDAAEKGHGLAKARPNTAYEILSEPDEAAFSAAAGDEDAEPALGGVAPDEIPDF